MAVSWYDTEISGVQRPPLSPRISKTRRGFLKGERHHAVSDPVITQWVSAAIAGDQEAFAELVYSFQDAVYNLCYRLLGERTEAEDCTQEAFLKAYANLRRYDIERPFKTWLLTIASNHCIDRLRKRRMTWVSIDEPLPATLALASSDPQPEQAALANERSRRIQALLDELPEEYRAAVVLRYWYDYSYVEIAEMLTTTESAIKSRLFRARQMLADKLGSTEASAGSGLVNPLLEGM
ncbi:MAG: sigma-70 family RNA polymerase sigma factor [Armatimonadetes bacterium]|nr:sigma-70 family RNA polymerase sigma factor [Anaerolineae bacterium]